MSNIPGSFNYVQIESVQFNNPVSESSLVGLGASINGLLSIAMPVGSVIHSMLTEIQFQNQTGNPSPATWILADGRNVTGSLYQTITGNTTIPDLRAIFLRGKDNGRGLDPHGDQALGTYNADQFASHNHGFSDPGHGHNTEYQGLGLSPKLRNGAYSAGSNITATDASGTNPVVAVPITTGITFSANGGSETNPKEVVVNIFIRIN